jgi:amino acid transporter
MEKLITLVSFSLFVGILLCPILLFRKIKTTKIRYKLLTYLTIGLFLNAVIVFVFAWWSYTSDLMLLEHYGYNIDGMNEAEFYGNVIPENMDKVKSIQRSIMGIGWPLKAIFAFVFCSPWIIVVYFVFYLTDKIKLNKLKIPSSVD